MRFEILITPCHFDVKRHSNKLKLGEGEGGEEEEGEGEGEGGDEEVRVCMYVFVNQSFYVHYTSKLLINI